MHKLLHFGIQYENTFAITQNALILQLLGGKAPRPQRGLCPLLPRWGHSPRAPIARCSGSAIVKLTTASQRSQDTVDFVLTLLVASLMNRVHCVSH